MVKKKAAPKKAKKAVKKAVSKKSVKTAKKVVKKSASKKASPKTVAVKAITDSTGVVTMKSVDDVDKNEDNQGSTVSPYFDKETGALIMVPDDDE